MVFEVNTVSEWSATDVIIKGITIDVFPYVYFDTAAIEEGPTKSYARIPIFQGAWACVPLCHGPC